MDEMKQIIMNDTTNHTITLS